MLDIKKIRKNPDFTKEKLATRGIKPETIDELIGYDAKRRDLIVESESLKAKRNDVSDQISQKKRNKEDASDAINQMKEVGQKIKGLDEQLRQVEEDEHNLAAHLPNIPHDGVPVSLTEEGSVELRKVGKIPSFDFKPKHHWDIGESLGILDFERAAKVSGSRFVYYIGDGALLERAVYNFYLDQNTAAGYTEVIPPFMVNGESMYGTGQFPKFLENKAGYEVNGTDMTMIPTAEVPLVNYYRGEVIPTEKLPVSVTALTPAFRSEAGSAGRDTKGLIRLHQFNKVEMVKFTKPEDSWDALEQITHQAELNLQKLGLAYHVITLTTSDMSFTAAISWVKWNFHLQNINMILLFGEFHHRLENQIRLNLGEIQRLTVITVIVSHNFQKGWCFCGKSFSSVTFGKCFFDIVDFVRIVGIVVNQHLQRVSTIFNHHLRGLIGN